MVANSAPVALEMLGDPGFSSQLSLVITDHIMPGMHGPEFVQNLRAVLPTVPVLVLSGLPDAMDAYEGLDIVFRLKPLAPEELIRVAPNRDGPHGVSGQSQPSQPLSGCRRRACACIIGGFFHSADRVA